MQRVRVFAFFWEREAVVEFTRSQRGDNWAHLEVIVELLGVNFDSIKVFEVKYHRLHPRRNRPWRPPPHQLRL